ncbi:hypothetical protein SPHINGO8BC_70128 [Sphingobacterium multivorum]|uniref:Uncharacterized protein n=1 Tax=Sphingobacterium multivorum TaxID=28454 RepID=A0A654DL57_SPHMU|nr:hypothetical protein SPHINGO8BC_70128 [Sphingobacterium multivorum]
MSKCKVYTLFYILVFNYKPKYVKKNLYSCFVICRRARYGSESFRTL